MTPKSPFRALFFRAAAVLVGLAPWLAAEAVLSLLGWGQADYSADPFLGFRNVRPLFRVSDDGTRYEIDPARQAFFRPDSFALAKPPDEFRIFCLGGSTVQGRPFEIETSFTTWLELSLQAADPSRKWEVINCGGVSYASFRLVPILIEVLRYEPDLIIVYTGHNEFLEDRTYGHLKHVPGVLAVPAGWLAQTRTYRLLREGYGRLAGEPQQPPRGFPILSTEVDAMLDYRGGLDRYHRDDAWRRATIEHYRYNLLRMAHLANEAHVPLLLMNPVSNLRDCPPLKSQHRDGLTDDERQQWERLVADTARSQTTDRQRSIELLCQAAAIDDQFAGLHFLLASHYDRLDMAEAARRHYVLAKENDICPLRMLEPMHDALVEVARETSTPLVDVRREFERLNDLHIPDSQHLVDHVHPSIEGHQRIAAWLTDQLIRQGIVRPNDGWQTTRDHLFQQHYESLDDFYFVKGAQRLEIVRRWTQGQAAGVRGETPATELEPPGGPP